MIRIIDIITFPVALFVFSEDFFNVFIAMAVLRWTAGNTQIYLTDLYPKGPFWYEQKTVVSFDFMTFLK